MRRAAAVLMIAGAWLPALGQDDKPDPVRSEYAAKLSSLRVTLDFRDAPLSDVISYLRDVTGMNLFIDSAVKEKSEVQVTIKVTELPLRSVLNLILKPHGLMHTYKDGVLFITTEEREEVKMELYDVRDLLFPIQQFPGVDFALSDDAGGIQVAQPDPEPEEIPIVDLIKAHTGGNSWDENPQVSIGLHNGLLVVKQTRSVHVQILRMISRLRDFK